MDQRQPSNSRGYYKKNNYSKTNQKEKKRRRSRKNMQQSSEARENTDQRESHGACVGNSVEGQMADGTPNCHVPLKENQRTLESNTDEFKQGAACSNKEEQSSETSKKTVIRDSPGTHVKKTAEQQEMAEKTLQRDVQRILESDLDVNNQNAAFKGEQSSKMSTSTREKTIKKESQDSTHVGIEGQEMADETLNCHADNISQTCQRTLEIDMDENKQNAACSNKEEQNSDVATSTREKTAKRESHDALVEKTSEGQEIADGTLNCHVPDNISQRTLEPDWDVENAAVEENSLPPSSEVKQAFVSTAEEGQTSLDENKKNPARYNEDVQEDSHLPSSEEKESSPSGTSKEGQPSTPDRRTERFGEHDIFQLRKKSIRFPNAKFFCRLCNYHLDTAELCKKHWKEPRHSKLEKNKNILKEIKSIDAPSEAHAEALTATLQATVDKIALSDDDLMYRAQIADTVERVLRKAMSDVNVILYGSSLSGFGFHDSDVNLCIEAPEGSTPSEVLVRAWEAFTPDDPHFEDVQADFEGRFPCVRFKDKNSGLRCELCTGSMSACLTSQLLRTYRELDPRLHPLAMALRHWARICKLDCQSDGSLPAYSYVLITIYYLQRCEPPVLPVLQEEETLEHQNTDSLGALWIKMLQFYTIEAEVEELVLSVRKRDPVHRDELKISCRRLAIEDPIATNKKSIAKSLSSSVMFQYFMDCLQNALLYFGKPQSSKSAHQPKSSSEKKCVNNHLNDVTDCNDQESPQRQPVEKSSETIHSTPQLGETTESDHDCAQSSDIESSSKAEVSDTHSRNTLDPQGPTNEKCESDSGIESSVQSTTIGSDSEINSTVTECSKNHVAANEVNNIHQDQSPCMEHTVEPCSPDCVDQGTPLDSNRETESMQPDDSPQEFSFTFDEKILTGGRTIIVCSGCGKEGHNTSECPEDALPELVELPPMKKPFMTKINALCKLITDGLCLKDVESHNRNQAVFSYEKFIRHHGYPGAELYLFGSSRNGFGFARSDMDVCLKFEKYENAEELDIPLIIEDLAKKLKKNRGLHHVIPITTAKVPIVKFVDAKLRLDVDISLYNCLAQANTHMLNVYSQMDPRVRLLVYTVKLFAKVCDIGDASKGSLSSYAFTLMAIFFLQQRKPPVLPVLQEIYDEGTRKPRHIIEGCNAWFCSDLRKVAQIWKGTNRESVGELWLGFLRFFTEEFNCKRCVVSIKQHKPLTRFQKMWTGASRGFAIEDPFDLDHNLGSGVSKKMAIYIMHVFINAREHFGTPNKIANYFRDDYSYFFDLNKLTGGELPPNDRCCKLCGKIGHFLKDCPHRKGNKDTNARRDRNEEMKRRKEKDNLASDTHARDSKPNAARKLVASSEKTGQAPTNNVASGAKAKTYQPSATYVRSTDTKPGPVPPSAAKKMAPNIQHKQLPATSEKAPTTSKVDPKGEKYNPNPNTLSDMNRKTKSPSRPVSQNNFRNMEHGVPPMVFTPRGQYTPRPTHDPRIQHQQMMLNRFPGPSSQQNPRPVTREVFQNVRREQQQHLENARQQQQSYNQYLVASAHSPPRDAAGGYVLFPPNKGHEQRPHPQSNMQHSPPNNQQFQARHAQQEPPGAWQEPTHVNRHVEQQQQHVRQDQSRAPQKPHPNKGHEQRPHPQWNMQHSPPNNQQFQARHAQQEPPGAWQEPTHVNRHVEQQQQHVRQDQSRAPQKPHPTQTRDNHVQSPPFSPERKPLNEEQHHHWATAQQPIPQVNELQRNQQLHYQQQGPYPQNWPPLHQQPNHQNWQQQNSHPVPRQLVRFPVRQGFSSDMLGQLAQLQKGPPNQQIPPNEKILTLQDVEN